MKKDFLGKELRVGDIVIFMDPHYKSFIKGTITKFTTHAVTISTEDRTGIKSTSNRESNRVVKVN